jgi:hypothetical protein
MPLRLRPARLSNPRCPSRWWHSQASVSFCTEGGGAAEVAAAQGCSSRKYSPLYIRPIMCYDDIIRPVRLLSGTKVQDSAALTEDNGLAELAHATPQEAPQAQSNKLTEHHFTHTHCVSGCSLLRKVHHQRAIKFVIAAKCPCAQHTPRMHVMGTS